ncbi:hypothetical protein WAE61_18225 [Comamonadaceae bacterium PP-2]
MTDYFVDEPDELDSPWPANPTVARYELVVSSPDRRSFRTVSFAPEKWASHRKTLIGWAWPIRYQLSVDFIDVVQATDLQTTQVLDRVELWKAILVHRLPRGDEVPWYVLCEDQHAIVFAFAFRWLSQHGKLGKPFFRSANELLSRVGYRQLEDDFLKKIGVGLRHGYRGAASFEEACLLLTPAELDKVNSMLVS